MGALRRTQPTSLDHEDLVRLFVGKNYEYYARKWTRIEQRKGLALKLWDKSSWNWPAFFVAFNWTAYRKMYGYSSLMVFVLVIHLVLAIGTSNGDAFNIFHLIFALLYGSLGNYWYKLHVEEKLKEITATGASNEAIRMSVVKEGGTNFGAAVVFSAVMIILMMLIGAFGK